MVFGEWQMMTRELYERAMYAEYAKYFQIDGGSTLLSFNSVPFVRLEILLY